MEGLFQNLQHGQVAAAAGGALALDDISKTRNTQFVFAK